MFGDIYESECDIMIIPSEKVLTENKLITFEK
jgi:hypothetical protein